MDVMLFKRSLLLLFMTDTVLCWIGSVQNKSNLVTKYEELCGSDFLCSADDTLTTSQNETSSQNKKRELVTINCPPCFCNNECEVSRNCCPDMILSSTCVQTKLFVYKQFFIDENQYLMVSSCPVTEKDFSGQNCHFPIEHSNFLSQVPVYSPITNKTYVNIQCSKCNGENEVIPWTYFISCPRKKVDLDAYSDAGHLWYDMQQNECSINYMPPLKSNPKRCKSQPVVAQCNITGKWEQYDEDVMNACRQYRNQYGVFQNVFCFICNSGSQEGMTSFSIDECSNHGTCSQNINKTKNAKNDTIDYATLYDTNVYTYTDALVNISQRYDSSENEYTADVNMLSWNLADDVSSYLPLNNITIETSDSQIVNLTSLYEEYVRAGGYENWCQDNHKIDKIYPGFKARKSCMCEENCYKYSSCCPDVALFRHEACVPGFIDKNFNSRTSGTYYFLISRCPMTYKYIYIKSRCEETFDYDVFNIPVTDVKRDKAYKNLYCFLCHNHLEAVNLNLTDVKAWKAKLVCPNVVFPMYMKSYTSLLQSAILNNCSVQFSSPDVVDRCEPETYDTINKCNVTGLVKSVSENARKLCENTGKLVVKKSRNYLYKNQICDLCNSETFEDPLGICYTGNQQNIISYVNGCTFGTQDVWTYPYKNDFCSKCNAFYTSRDLEFIGNIIMYRDLFSFSETISYTVKSVETDCSEKEFKDVLKNTCRQLLCSRGKVLTNNTCSYIVPYDRELRYRLALQVSMSSFSRQNNIRAAIKDFQRYIQQEINEGVVEIEEKYVYSNTSCNSLDTSENVTHFEGLIFLQMKIKNMIFPIDRNSLEMHLLNLRNITIHLDDVKLEFQESAEAWYLPLFVRQDMLTSDSCYMKEVLATSDSENSVVPFINDVNNLLLCVQIQLEENEYVLSDDFGHVYVETIRRSFKINEFVKSDNASIRLCLNSYKQFIAVKFELKSDDNLVETVLVWVTYLSTILSILALLVTFVIYCILPTLRTIPGKNLMCVAFSLSFAQLLFIIRSHITDDIACSWIGGFTHYFWISVFTCTNVCCFHMFRMFVRHSLVHGNTSADRKLFITYCLISFILPMIPVSINLIIPLLDIDSVSFGYGGSKCFLVSHLALITTFILPIVLQIIFNIVMFSITFHFIKNTPKVRGSQERHELSIFFKLFLLTGVSWLFMIVDGFFNVSPFTFLATIISGSLGVFIFIAYVCHKNVFKLLKRKFCLHDVYVSSRTNMCSATNSHTQITLKSKHTEKEDTLI